MAIQSHFVANRLAQLSRRSFKNALIPSALQPSLALPLRARITTSTSATSADVPDTVFHSTASPPSARQTLNPNPTLPPIQDANQQHPSRSNASENDSSTSTTVITSSTATSPISDNVRTLLPLLKAQAPHYITAHIHAKPYLLTAGDTLRLPFWMHDVNPGDVIRLNRASTLGSRDYTLKAGAKSKPAKGSIIAGGNPNPGYLDERLFICRATVLGSVSEPMRFIKKTKRRQRKVKTIKSKHRYTVLKISELTVRGVDDIEEDGEIEIEEPSM